MQCSIINCTEHEKINTGGGGCHKGIAPGKKNFVKGNVAEHEHRWDYINWATWMDVEEPTAEHVLQATGKADEAKVWLPQSGGWNGVGGEEGGVIAINAVSTSNLGHEGEGAS